MLYLTILIIIYGGLWLWSSWEYRQRAVNGHTCTCHNGKCREHD